MQNAEADSIPLEGGFGFALHLEVEGSRGSLDLAVPEKIDAALFARHLEIDLEGIGFGLYDNVRNLRRHGSPNLIANRHVQSVQHFNSVPPDMPDEAEGWIELELESAAGHGDDVGTPRTLGRCDGCGGGRRERQTYRVTPRENVEWGIHLQSV